MRLCVHVLSKYLTFQRIFVWFTHNKTKTVLIHTSQWHLLRQRYCCWSMNKVSCSLSPGNTPRRATENRRRRKPWRWLVPFRDFLLELTSGCPFEIDDFLLLRFVICKKTMEKAGPALLRYIVPSHRSTRSCTSSHSAGVPKEFGL